MRALYITLSFIFLLSIFAFFNIPSKIQAEKGVARLEKNFSESHSYSLLTGEWEVYSDRLITPQEFSAGSFSPTMFKNFSQPSFFSSKLPINGYNFENDCLYKRYQLSHRTVLSKYGLWLYGLGRRKGSEQFCKWMHEKLRTELHIQ